MEPINIDKVPFRFILGIKRLDNIVTLDELLYNMIRSAEELTSGRKVDDGKKWVDIDLTFKYLKWIGKNVIVDGNKDFEESIKLLVELGYIIKGSTDKYYKFNSHPWI